MCGMKLPITLIGLGTGFGFNFDGPSHHGIHDLAVIKSLPELEVINLSTPDVAKKSAEYSYRSRKPLLIRLDKGAFEDMEHKPMKEKGEWWNTIQEEKKNIIITTGTILYKVRNMFETGKIDKKKYGLIDLIKVKGEGKALMAEYLRETDNVITIEENVRTGGIYEVLREMIDEYSLKAKLKGINISDEQTFKYGSREWLLDYYGLSEEKIEATIKKYAKQFN